MGKNYDGLNRFMRNFCCVLYFVFFLISHAQADELECYGAGIGPGTAPAPRCTALNVEGRNYKIFKYQNGQGASFDSPPPGNYSWTCKEQNTGGTIYGGACGVKKNSCQAGAEPPGSFSGEAGTFWASPGVAGGSSVCMSNNCVATGDSSGSNGVGVGGGATSWQTYFKNMKQTGAACNYDDQQKQGNSDKKNCGPGESTFQVGDKVTCIPNGQPEPKKDPKPKTETTTKETNSPDGTKTKTETKTTTTHNGNGTSTTTTTTTTTKFDGSGNVIGTETSTETKQKDDGNLDDEEEKEDDFCKKNPTLNICKNSSVSGDCENTTCEGDAITCAIIQLQKKNDCELKKDTPEKILGRQIAEGNDPKATSLPTIDNAQNIDLAAQNLNSEGWGIGGSCIADKQIFVMGQEVNIPFSKLCDFLLALRAGIMLLAGIFSFKILSGAVLTV